MIARTGSISHSRVQYWVKVWLAVAAIAAGALGLQMPTHGQTVLVAPAVKISPSGKGAHWWVNLVADPNDGRRLLVCGTRTEPGKNSMVGFVYLSTDSGRNWQQTLVDTSTSWVSEESCAFGPNGRAYFIASASDVNQGTQSHSRGTTRVYRSTNGGASWKLTNIGGFIDYTATAVDQTNGPHRGRMYIFGNRVYSSANKTTSMVLISSCNEGTTLSPPVTHSESNPDPAIARFPSAAVVLNDGTALAGYWHYLQKSPNTNNRGVIGHVEVVSSLDGGRSLTSPVVVGEYESPEWDGWKDPFIGIPAIAVDRTGGPHGNRVYLAWSTFDAINLAFSDDGGQHWSAPVAVVSRDSSRSDVGAPEIAVNRHGVLALAWAADKGTCTFFAISHDGGQSFTRRLPISSCRTHPTEVNPASMINFLHAMPVSVARTDTGLRFDAGLGISLRIRPGYAGLWQTNMIADANGAFHPVWIEVGTGGGQLWTTTVIVGESDRPPRSALTESLTDFSRQVAIEVVSIDYNDLDSTVSMDVTLQNNTGFTIGAPLFLKGLYISSDIGAVLAANADNVAPGGGPLWDLSQSFPEGGLRSGERTAPYRLAFRLTNAVPRLYGYPVSARLAVYGRQIKEAHIRRTTNQQFARRSLTLPN